MREPRAGRGGGGEREESRRGRETEAEKRDLEKVRKEKQLQAADKKQRAKSSSANDPAGQRSKGISPSLPDNSQSAHTSLSQSRPKCSDTFPKNSDAALPTGPRGARGPLLGSDL